MTAYDSLKDIISALPKGPSWGPPTTLETTLDGVPYAPFSKGDKIGRMADWTTDGKDRDRMTRQAYGRSYRGSWPLQLPPFDQRQQSTSAGREPVHQTRPNESRWQGPGGGHRLAGDRMGSVDMTASVPQRLHYGTFST